MAVETERGRKQPENVTHPVSQEEVRSVREDGAGGLLSTKSRG